jgi:putative ABC transport system permease protein
MFRHVLKLTWNRRRANALVAIEVTAVFIVLFLLASTYWGLWTNYKRPLGFEWENVWEVQLSVPGDWDEEDGAKAFQALDAVRAHPEVEAAHAINITPFRSWNWTDHLGTADTQVRTWMNFTSIDGLEDLGVTLIEGRWFEEQDEGQPYEAVVVNRMFRDEVFGTADPLGVNIRPQRNDPEEQTEYRIVGVFEDLRQRGEFAPARPYAVGMYDPSQSDLRVNFLYVRLTPGTTASFEETLLRTVQGVAPDWGLSVTAWKTHRTEHHRNTLLPLYIMSTVAAFLLLMVALGLIGVLWQEVVRRTQEIGLRRALGAPTGKIRRQISLELIMVASFGILLGIVLAIQLPMLGLLSGGITWQTAPVGLLVATAIILALVFLSSLYPSWVASRSTPAEALRYE